MVIFHSYVSLPEGNHGNWGCSLFSNIYLRLEILASGLGGYWDLCGLASCQSNFARPWRPWLRHRFVSEASFSFAKNFNPCVRREFHHLLIPSSRTASNLFPTVTATVAGCPLPWCPACSARLSGWRWSPSLLFASALGSCFPCRPVASGRPTHRFQGMPWTPWTEQLAEASFSMCSMFAMCLQKWMVQMCFPKWENWDVLGTGMMILLPRVSWLESSCPSMFAKPSAKMSSATIRWQVWNSGKYLCYFWIFRA